MTHIAPLHPRSRFAGASVPGQQTVFLDGELVADAIRGSGWSVEFCVGSDYEEFLVVLPDDDEQESAFAIYVAGPCFRLQECRADALHDIGDFSTLEEAIQSLRSVMSDTWHLGRRH